MLPVLCSADGLSLAAQYSELITYSITLAYNLRHGALSPLSQHYVCGATKLLWGRAARLVHAAAHSVECAIVDLFSKSARQAFVLCALGDSISVCWTDIDRMHACASGYSFSTYGDTAACWLQDIILVLLIAKYR